MVDTTLPLPGNQTVGIESDNMISLYIDKTTYDTGRVLGTPLLIFGIILNGFFLKQVFEGNRIFHPVYQIQMAFSLINLVDMGDFLTYQNFFLGHTKVDKGSYCVFHVGWNMVFKYSYYTIHIAHAFTRYKLVCADHVLSKEAKDKISRLHLVAALVTSLGFGILSSVFLIDYDGSKVNIFKFGSMYLFCRKRIEVDFLDASENLVFMTWSTRLKVGIQALSLLGPGVLIYMSYIIAIYKFYTFMKDYISNMHPCLSKNERRQRLLQNTKSFKGLVTMFIVNIAADLSGMLAAEWKPENVIDNSTLSYLPQHFLNWVLTPLLFCLNFQDKALLPSLFTKFKTHNIAQVQPWPVSQIMDVDMEMTERNTVKVTADFEIVNNQLQRREDVEIAVLEGQSEYFMNKIRRREAGKEM